jgi:hypothetical protein
MRISKCYYCLCPMCNMLKCRAKSKLQRCLWCTEENDKIPTLDCDFWESKIKRKAFHIRRIHKTQLKILNDNIEELLKKL